MKITEVRVILTCPTRNHLFVKVCTDQGIHGVGEGTLNGSEPIVAAAIQHAGELLIGMDPLRTEDLWQLIYNWSCWRGGAIYMTALAALDMALWDIKGKVAKMPVYQLLGGRSHERPGLGMDIDEKAAAKYPYQKAWMPLIRRPDGTVHHF